MIDPAKLAAFAFVTGLVSLTPGPQMVFVMTQAAWRGPLAGVAALAGLQLGNATWFVMAGLGLGTLAVAWPGAFTGLTVAGALYLAWLGVNAWRRAGAAPSGPAPRASGHALRDSLAVSLSTPSRWSTWSPCSRRSSIRACRPRRSSRCLPPSPSRSISRSARFTSPPGVVLRR